MNLRIYRTNTFALLADFDSDYIPRIGEHVIVGPHLNIGDIRLSTEWTHEVLKVVYQAPWCVHVIVDHGVEGSNLGTVAVLTNITAAGPDAKSGEAGRDDSAPPSRAWFGRAD